jgi:DNA mismatch endonuclease (patch repair protein)
MDTRTPEQRTRIMRSVLTKNTGPEMIVRRTLHALGYRYRLHSKSLPGKPDIVFPSRKKVIFVHGCFWHGHACKKGALPKSRLEYWGDKMQRNQTRDRTTTDRLKELGWDALVVWQCEIKDTDRLKKVLRTFVGR